MHIESVSFETVKWLSRNGENISKQQVKENNGKMYCLFDYGNRNPLSKDAKVIVLSHL